MGFPELIKIGGIHYEIEHEDAIIDEGVEQDGQIVFGEARIRMKKNLQSSVKRCVLIHEIIHGICDAYGIKSDEATVDRLSHGIDQVLYDNKDLRELY